MSDLSPIGHTHRSQMRKRMLDSPEYSDALRELNPERWRELVDESPLSEEEISSCRVRVTNEEYVITHSELDLTASAMNLEDAELEMRALIDESSRDDS